MPGEDAESGRDYVKKRRDSGYSDDEIRQNLREAGWAEGQIDGMLAEDEDEAGWRVRAPDGTFYGPYTQSELKEAVNTQQIQLDWKARRGSDAVVSVKDALPTPHAKVESAKTSTETEKKEDARGDLVECSECGERISKTAEKCPGCGAVGPAGKQGACIVLGFLGLIVVGAIIAAIVYGTRGDSAKESGPDKSMAWVMARNFVEDRLKSPGTADYGWQTYDDQVEYLGENRYRAHGWVDAENVMGGTRRINWVCVVEYVGNDKWRLVDINMAQR